MLRRLLADLNPVERVVLFAVAVLHVVGIGWGLPASDGWDVDGIAPRDFLPGLVDTFTPGHYFTYPPFHLAVLTVLTLPVTIVELVRAPSTAPADLVPMFTAVPVMTIFALVARLVSFAMSLGIVVLLGRIATTIFGSRRAAAWTMAVAGVEAAGTYYAHTTNLDLPALFWGTLALATLVQAIEKDAPGSLRRVAVFAAFAIASKDQAYALFAISMPVVFALWLRTATDRSSLLKAQALCGVIVVGLVLLLDGAVFNPSGFRARLAFLTGPASQDFAQHAKTMLGRISAFQDTVTFLPHHYSVFLIPVFLVGIWFALRGKRDRELVIALIPLLGILSFTLAFNCVARRVEERFVLPQMQLLAVYAGGMALLKPRWARALAAAAIVPSLRMAATVDANMLGDARYDAEAFMREAVAPNETIETYGNNVYLPRFPETAKVTRVGTTPARKRNPMPGIMEMEDHFGEVAARSPKWIVVPQGFAWRYLQQDHGPDAEGRILPKTQREELKDEDTTTFIRALFAENAGYALAHHSHYAGNVLFPPRPLHASLATDVYVFERR